MKRAFVLILVAVAVILLLRMKEPPPTAPINGAKQDEHPVERSSTVDIDAVREDVRILHGAVMNFLLAVKEPYRPPLGINEDFAKALSGGNKYGDVYIATNDPSLNDRGQLIDRWGTPYHFHPRAPDAIDVRSAGPDRVLFNGDDIVVTH